MVSQKDRKKEMPKNVRKSISKIILCNIRAQMKYTKNEKCDITMKD